MSSQKHISIRQWYHQSPLDFQYAGRILRAVCLRLLLHCCLLCFKIESIVNPIKKDHHKRILVIVIGGMGDCLLFDPLFRRLKERWPQARIDVFTGCFELMWERMGSVDNLILFRPTQFKSPWAYARMFRALYRSAYDIVAEGIAMMPKRGIYPLLTSFVIQASQAKIRIGRNGTGRMETLRAPTLGFISQQQMLAQKNRGPEAQSHPYLTHIVSPPPPHLREFHESAYIFESLGLPFRRDKNAPALVADDQADKGAHAFLRSQWGKPDDIIIALTMETTRKIKAWPLDRFAQVVDKGIQNNYKFVVLGLDGAAGQELAHRFPKEKVINLAGHTDLAEMIALIGQCDAFFSCDTGPSHIAQACRVPTVVLFGPSNEKEFGPADTERHTLLLPQQELKCRPCVLGPCVRGKSCMHMIEPEIAFQELKEAVERSARSGNELRFDPSAHVQHRLCEI